MIGSSISVYVNAGEQEDGAQLAVKVNHRVVLLCAIAAGAVVASYIQTVCWMMSAQNISARVRRAYFRSLFRQDIQYLDGTGVGKLTDTMSSNITTLQDTLSQKTGLFVASVSTFVSAFVVALIRNWKLALILSTVLPAMFVVTLVMSTQVAKNAQRASSYIVQAHDVVSDAVSSIKVVRTLQAENILANQYRNALQQANRALWMRSVWQSSIWGWVFFVRFALYSLALWEGSRLLVSENLDFGIMINILYSVIIGTVALSRVSRSLHEFGIAIDLANELFEMINRGDAILGTMQHRSSAQITGQVSFRNVDFAYSSRSDIPVLNGLDLTISSGQTTAIVGHSGAGKSTIAGLIQQFYQPTSGTILIDERPLDSVNLSCLRSQISFVSQDPFFFSMSVLENVRLGLIGTLHDTRPLEEQKELVREACELAGISQVIENLPQGYNTLLGSDGLLLSGGEKQRLAFARAIIRDPKILILDEPTSALDKKSEGQIQSTLRQIASNRTVIVIAHRLDTIKNADSIAVLDSGKVVEQGTHEELIQSGQLYRSLFTLYGKGDAEAFISQSDALPQLRTTSANDSTDRESLQTGKSVEDSPTEMSLSPSTASESGNVVSHFVKLLRFNRPEWCLLGIGNLASAISGCLYPFQALLFAKSIALEQLSAPNSVKFQHTITHYALFFFVIAIISGVSHSVSTFTFGVSFDKVLNRVRLSSFRGVLQRDIHWFAAAANSSSSLVFLLLHQYNDLAGLHGKTLSILVEIVTNMSSVIIFSLVVSWKYALVLLSVIPLIFVSYYFRIRTMRGFLKSMTQWHQKSGQMACETIPSIRTVASLGAEEYFFRLYSQHLSVASKVASDSVWKQSLIFAITQGLVYAVNAFGIWYGARSMADESIDIYQFFAIFIALTFGAQDSGEAISLLPDLPQAVAAAERLAEVSPHPDRQGPLNSQILDLAVHETGHIVFHDVSFRYPQRSISAIPDLNMSIKKGQHVAIIGPSGSGKSTVLSLLAGLYRPCSGRITFGRLGISSTEDGYPATSFYQSMISVVPQEPNLFSGSVRYNITLGNPAATDEQIQDACRQAGILAFIQSLPDGFDTICGPKELSVGQRQRITFARALVRNPRVLLFDEPTASLDAQSARQIISAIRSSGGEERITVTVTHSPANVLWADMVFVFMDGRVVEAGAPEDLMKQEGGFFAKLVAAYHT
jgi:ATP-binding cassette, subfamily B (MDR/TAP), member 1